MILYRDWKIESRGLLARQFDHLSRRLEVTGDLPESWDWAMLVQVDDAMDIIPLEPMEGGVGHTLTEDQLSLSGYYSMQLRGTQGEVVKHTNVIRVFVSESLSGSGKWPTVPSEFLEVERRILELNEHPPIPGEDGFWLIWDPDEDKYMRGEQALPDFDTAMIKSFVVDEVSKEAEARQTEIAVERERINQLVALPEGSTTGDAELTDIRVGYDGTVYDTAGEAVRAVANKVDTDINRLEDDMSAALDELKNSAPEEQTYTNLLETIAQEDSTTDNPTAFPAHKTNVAYEHGWYFGFYAKGMSGYECYVLEAKEGDRFIVSGYDGYSGVMKSLGIAFVDKDFGFISTGNTHNFNIGIEPCPSNTAYVIINKAMDSYVPKVYSVDEPLLKSDWNIPAATKAPEIILYGEKHYCYFGDVGTTPTYQLKNADVAIYAAGIYPLEAGKEYVLCYNDAVIPEWQALGYICNSAMAVNMVISEKDRDKNNCYRFTAAENDKYIVLNCFDFDGNLQFGEARVNRIKVGAKIGNAFYDGKHDLTLQDIGAIDRSLTDKKWVSYGDSITAGTGINHVSGGEKRWQDYIVERYGIGSHVYMGVGYSALTTFDTATEIPMSDDRRLDPLIAEQPDIVTILGGANDYVLNLPIGTDEDITNRNRYTFKGAYAYIIHKILTAKPDTAIVILGMFHNAAGNYAHKGGKSVVDFAVASKEIAEHFGLPFVDLNECGFNAYNFNDTDGVFSTDGIHPNAEGAKRVAMVVSKWFDTFKGTIY